MNNAPEGLDYGTSHQGEKNMLEEHLEKGKCTTGATPSPQHEEAEMKRMLHCGSSDPVYESSKKNK